MPSVSELQRLKEEVEELKSKEAKAQGAIQQFRKDNKNMGDVEAIREKLVSLETQRVDLEEEYNKALSNYRKTVEGKANVR